MCFTASVIFRVSWRAREARPCVGVATTGVFTVLLPICACSLHNDQGCQQARQQRSALPSRLGNARPPQPPQDGDLAGAGTAALRRCAPDGGCEAPAVACLSSQISRASGLPQRTSSPPPPPPLPTGARARRGSEVRDVAGETSVSKHQREKGACRAEGRGGRVGVGEEGDAATILGTRRPQHSKRPAHNRNKHSNHGRLNSIPPFLALLDPPDLPLLRSLLLTRSLTYIFTHTHKRACTHTHTKK